MQSKQYFTDYPDGNYVERVKGAVVSFSLHLLTSKKILSTNILVHHFRNISTLKHFLTMNTSG